MADSQQWHEVFETVYENFDAQTEKKIAQAQEEGWTITSITLEPDGSVWCQMALSQPTRGFRGRLNGHVRGRVT